MKLIGYGRASTFGQQLTKEVQEEKIKEYCQLYGHELVDFCYDHGLTGKNINRPALDKALTALENDEAEGVIIFKLDRLTRNVKDLCHLIQNYFATKYTLISVSDLLDTKTANGRLIINVLGSVAQWEVESTIERTKSALAAARRQGKHLGKVPYGYKLTDGFLEDCDEEIEIVTLMQSLRIEGKSYQAIAGYLNAQQLMNRGGKTWKASSIHDILNRSKLA
ncbi:MAG: recombinase family protein [Pelatocladus maniniholoensis HA4357-MV3]|jgi:site-specific DNA recombinase|uniref:Recombinase family protein n=1 Tax=Pelatocladus maniniholoensis HA4357-MV3 TaxID=1117104 RepID=A0A9E3HAG8_9NOST|nr:recombinase family protein [Pelatocladus maniniholoensis HA4357-MV3]